MILHRWPMWIDVSPLVIALHRVRFAFFCALFVFCRPFASYVFCRPFASYFARFCEAGVKS